VLVVKRRHVGLEGACSSATVRSWAGIYWSEGKQEEGEGGDRGGQAKKRE